MLPRGSNRRLKFCSIAASIRDVPRGSRGNRGPRLEQPQDRESIWSVRRQTRELYFVAFILLFLLGAALVALRAHGDGGSLLDITLAVWSDAAPLVITAAAAALAFTEIGRIVMVLARRLEEGLERVREQRRAEGRVEGKAEADRLWRAWNARRLEAEAEGRPFAEPPPDVAELPGDNGAH